MVHWGWLTVYIIKLSLLILLHIVTITTIKCVLVHSIIFLFYILHTSTVAPGGFRGVFNLPPPPSHIFSNSVKFLKRSIIYTFPCVVVFALNLVLRHLNVLNFSFPLRSTTFTQNFLNIKLHQLNGKNNDPALLVQLLTSM